MLVIIILLAFLGVLLIIAGSTGKSPAEVIKSWTGKVSG